MKNNQLQPNTLKSQDSKNVLIHDFESGLREMNQSDLNLVIKKLNFLCLNFDPYNSSMSVEVENIINEYGLTEFTSNPFEFTNIVLQILDKTENFIKSRAH